LNLKESGQYFAVKYLISGKDYQEYILNKYTVKEFSITVTPN